MLEILRIASIVILIGLSSSDVAAEQVTNCPGEQQPKKGVVTRTKSADPMVQEITLQCGTQTVGQIASVAPVAASAPSDSNGSFHWDAFVDALFKLLGSLAWPVAAVYIAFVFRKEFAALLSRLKKGKWGSAEFEFENYVREVEAEADIPRAPDAENVSPSAAARASSDPRGAIVSAWIEVEETLFRLVRNKQLDTVSLRPSRGTVGAIRAVQKAQALDANWVALFHDLRAMRNEAAHSTDFTPPPDAVLKYVQLAKELTAAMRAAGG
ncbi:hypothetical protein [Roseateles sp. P5_D6]